MLESFLVTLRETLEASLILFIIVSYLHKANQGKHIRIVIWGAAIAIVASIVEAWLIYQIAGGLTEHAEAIFEGVLMLLAAILLTSMILWMARAQHVRHQIESRVQTELTDKHRWGLFALAFLSIQREGIETVIFLNATIARGSAHADIGAVLGIIMGILAGLLLFKASRRMELKAFFRVTSLLLIFFAAGLLAHGIHEFQEIGWLTFGMQEVWNTNHLLDENSMVGGILKGLFGYNGNPSLLEVLIYIVYLVGIISAYKRITQKTAKTTA